jgi:transglutaminase-like putative cysteine protease
MPMSQLENPRVSRKVDLPPRIRKWKFDLSTFDRKKTESVVLAVVGLIAVISLRYPIESRPLLLTEIAVIGVGFLAAVFFRRVSVRRHLSVAALATLIIAPVAAAVLSRQLAAAIAFEMTALTLVGTAALSSSIQDGRPRLMSLVASGFLTLFATVISDGPYAIGIAIAWMTICVWHLIANHWERVDVCAVEHVTRQHHLPIVTLLAAVVIFVIAGLIARDRFGESQRLTVGWMPTSGGSSWSDPGALRGIGTGDAAIAAKDKAESFGAVDSELFLESTDSTLFDMFSDSLGQPKLKNKWERRQGMTADKIIESHSRTAKSEKGGSSFSTDRHPPEKHLHLQDAHQNAVVQWVGPSGIRLAMNRFDTFDGVEWTNQSELRNESFRRSVFGDEVWFLDPSVSRFLWKHENQNSTRGTLKMIRLKSTRIPAPMMTGGVHIKDIDRVDFFATDADGSLFMPGREKVPALTLIHLLSAKLSEDEFIHQLEGLRDRAIPLTSKRLAEQSRQSIREAVGRIVRQCARDGDTRHAKLSALVDHLRTEFELDRSAQYDSDIPLLEFFEQKRGGEHLFATAAALVARQIGLQSRLVTGLYVSPSGLDLAAGHHNVMPRDAHVWVEIKLADGRWVEIEPTPGFKPPDYRPSLWLRTQRVAALYWPWFAVACIGFAVVYFTRLLWIDWLLSACWQCSSLLKPRRRVVLAVWIIEQRAQLLGRARPLGSPPREWLVKEVLAAPAVDHQLQRLAESFCDLADQLFFGNPENTGHLNSSQSNTIDRLVHALRIRTLRQLLSENHR